MSLGAGTEFQLPLIRVTRVLELAGLIDFRGIPSSILEKARHRGQEVHAVLELCDLGLFDPADAPEELSGYVAAYSAFLKGTQFKPDLIEHHVVSQAYGYEGTLDRRGSLNESRAVLDIKCVAFVPAATRLQLMGYTMALEEESETREIHRRLALQLFPDGKYSLHDYKDRYNDKHDWLSAVRIAHWKVRHMGETP